MTTTATTWTDLTALEPQLIALLAEARSLSRRRKHCTAAAWIDTIRPALNALVGHYATGPEELRTSAAWNVARDQLVPALGDCRGECGCL